jgi:hypothetical protein
MDGVAVDVFVAVGDGDGVSVAVLVAVGVLVLVTVAVRVAVGSVSTVELGSVVGVRVPVGSSVGGTAVFVSVGSRGGRKGTNRVCPASSLELVMQFARISVSCVTPNARLKRKIVSPGRTT